MVSGIEEGLVLNVVDMAATFSTDSKIAVIRAIAAGILDMDAGVKLHEAGRAVQDRGTLLIEAAFDAGCA